MPHILGDKLFNNMSLFSNEETFNLSIKKKKKVQERVQFIYLLWLKNYRSLKNLMNIL